MDKKAIAEFIATLLHSATVAHFKHLQVTGPGSYAAHKALAGYYEEIPGLVDTVAESIQGWFGEIITEYPTSFENNSQQPLEYIESLKVYVEESRYYLPDASEIQNEIDAIATLLNSTAYKLRFLK